MNLERSKREGSRRKGRTKSVILGVGALLLATSSISGIANGAGTSGILEPVLTKLNGVDVRVPRTSQVTNGVQNNLVSSTSVDALGAQSMTGHKITQSSNPNEAMNTALQNLADAAKNGNQANMSSAAQELNSILLGTTSGRIYDGFAMLNYNQGAYAADHVPGEYKMKKLRDTGLTDTGIDGKPHKIWAIDVNMLLYGGQIDADTYLMRVPVEADENDLVRVNYHIYTLEGEEFSPALLLNDKKTTVSLPFKGLDSVWESMGSNKKADITVDYPPVGMINGIYTWGWRQHPPRIQFLQPVFEVRLPNGTVDLDATGQSFAVRNRDLTIDKIGDAAPEKKMYTVAQAVLKGTATPAQVYAMLTDANTAPRGTWQNWVDLTKNQGQIPPEAQDLLAKEGISPGKFGPYQYVAVYMNNEMYGNGDRGWNTVSPVAQGNSSKVKVINLDKHTHYYMVVDFGSKLSSEISTLGNGGGASFETFGLKPIYGVNKVAELQWRAGWGFRPMYDVIQQQDVFPRSADQAQLKAFSDGSGKSLLGYQYSAAARQGDFRFNPPKSMIGTPMNPSAQFLKEADGTDGLVIGQLTEGYGVAKMPMGDLSAYHPMGNKNMDTNGDGIPDVLMFPDFMRNPNANGGDIIPPTSDFAPFLTINPNNGTLYIDPADPSKGYWADLTYFHGVPVKAGTGYTATIEMPKASGQVFYQFDQLYHDNAIFSPHAQ